MNIRLDPIKPEHREFLLDLYCTTRFDIDRAPISDEQKNAIKRHQFESQHTYYQERFSSATFELISIDQKPVGRIYLDQGTDEFRLIDIALLPEYRGQGIGTKLINGCIAQAETAGLPLRLRVEPDNPALRLYQRLGFQVIADEQINYHLEWRPNSETKGTEN